MPDDPRPPAQIVNLWVRRREREILADERRLVWTCTCGSRCFYWYDLGGLVCWDCEKPQEGYDRR